MNSRASLFSPRAQAPFRASTYALTRQEYIKAVANRWIYSRHYTMFYLLVTLLSLSALIWALNEQCPSIGFILLEVLVNVAMIMEVSMQVIASGRDFARSMFNLLDVLLVLVCIITLVLLTTGCSVSKRRENVIDSVFLILRNTVQIIRLVVNLRKNIRDMKARNNDINLDIRESYYDNDDFEQVAPYDTGLELGQGGGHEDLEAAGFDQLE